MKQESDDSFLQMMQEEGVTPLKHSSKADISANQSGVSDSALQARRLAAVDGEQEGLSTGPIEPLHPLDPVAWKRDGVQEGVYRNLRLGKYQVDARLDLTRKTIPQCRDELLAFIQQCIKYDIRTILVHHGRAKQAEAKANQVKSYLNLWLSQLPEVMAFHSATHAQGGLGAIYVLLRKSEAKRLDNWEQHQKR